METLETLGRKIRTAHDLLSVVKTMKSLAAVNIRQYESAAEALNEYADVIARGWQAFFRNRPQIQGRKRDTERVCLVLGSDQGMCGQFNEAIIQYALNETQAQAGSFGAPLFWSAGERVRAGLEEAVKVEEHLSLPSSTGAIADLIFAIVERLALLREARPVDNFVIFYNHLGKVGTYEPSMHQVLPLVKEWTEKQRREKWPTRSFPMLGAEAGILFEGLFQQHIFAAVYKTFAQSLASENAARLSAMQVAEKNILEMEDGLQGRFRETRQNSITAELLDIISGFEAISPS
jgi:F-type H+-transporting ATPase subunit gamma